MFSRSHLNLQYDDKAIEPLDEADSNTKVFGAPQLRLGERTILFANMVKRLIHLLLMGRVITLNDTDVFIRKHRASAMLS